MTSNQMPKVDFVKDKELLKNTAVDYIKHIDKLNLDRATNFIRTRRNNIITGCLLGLGVTGIFIYTIKGVKQEKFLDDFEEPAKISS